MKDDPVRIPASDICIAVLALALAGCSTAQYSVVEKSVAELNADIAAGRASAESVTLAYLARIAREEPKANAIIALNPRAVDAARAADARRKAGSAKGPLDGMTVLIKDNIDFAGMATTAGSLALIDNVPTTSAPVVRRLEEAGAVILGKTNLSEWANFRSTRSISGWSAVGGLTRNPYAPGRSGSGSSTGSGAAAALSFATLTIGTETSGSVISPAALQGLVGLKPTLGLVSRTGIIPISHNHDTAGPMTRIVADAAVLLTAMAGSDPNDALTAEADAHKTDYLKGLDAGALKGARIGVMRFFTGYTPKLQAVFEAALASLKAQGAILVDIENFTIANLDSGGGPSILQTDFKVDLNAYLAKTPPAVKTRSLADLVAFNAGEPRETVLFGQELFEAAEKTAGIDDPAYLRQLERAKRTTGPEGIDRLLMENNVVALIQPTTEPAALIDTATGLYGAGGGPSAAALPAMAGYPHLTVPMGAVAGLPVGISFIGTRWSEQLLLSLGFAFEQATHARRPPDGTAGDDAVYGKPTPKPF